MKTNLRVSLVLAMAIVALTAAIPARAAEMTSAPAAREGELEKVSKPADQPDQPAATGAAEPSGEQGGGSARPGQQSPQGGLQSWTLILLLGGAFLLMMLWSSRSKRKQESQRRQMLANLKKGDKVTSIGGIVGTIADVREDEVIVKVDENARVKFARWAIRGVGEQSKAEGPDDRK